MALTMLTTLSIKANFNFTFEKLRRDYHPPCWFGGICYQVILNVSDLLESESCISPGSCLCSSSTDLLQLSQSIFFFWHDLNKRVETPYSSSASRWVDSAHPPEAGAEESTAPQTENKRWEVLKSPKYWVGFFAVVVLSDCPILGEVFSF